MRIGKHEFKLFFYWLFTWPHFICYLITPKKHRINLRKDMERIWLLTHKNNFKYFYWTLYNMLVMNGNIAFRNIFYMRIGHLKYLVQWLLPAQVTCYISTKRDFIGGGLIIQHGWAMTIDAKSVGENLWINQCVTVGWIGDKQPSIGNNVRIGCGAVVLGGINVNDNVKIGANAIVVDDVPPNCTVVCAKAKIVKKDTNLL